jgi:pimeloyl-ACP methyl ester carboxylesterase
MEVDLVYYHT